MARSRWHRRTLINTLRLSPPQMAIMLIALGLLWRTVRFAMGFPIWGDESFVAVNFIVRDFGDLLDPLLYGQIVPLAFMWMEWTAGKLLGYGEYALRLFPFLFGMVSLALFWSFARRTIPKRAAVLAVGIFAASYYIVRHSVEAKPYGMDLFFSLALTFAAWLTLQEPKSVCRWVILALMMAIIPWCSYPGIYVGCAVLLALGLRVLKEGFRKDLIVGMIIVLALFAVSTGFMYVEYAKPHAEFAQKLKTLDLWKKAFFPVDDPGFIPLWLIGVHTGEMFGYPHGGAAPTSIGTFLLFLIGAFRIWKIDRSLFWLILTPFAVALAASALKIYPYGGAARIAQYLAPGICLLAGLGLYTLFQKFLSRPARRWGMDIAVVSFSVLAIGGMVQSVVRPYKSASVKQSYHAMRKVQLQSGPNDRWVVFNSDKTCDYAPYLGEWWGVGGQFVYDALRFAPHKMSFEDFAPHPDSLEIPEDGALVVLVYHARMNKVDRDPPKVIKFPDDQLDAYIQSLKDRLGPYGKYGFPVKKETEKVIDEDGKVREEIRKLETIRVYRFSPNEVRTN